MANRELLSVTVRTIPGVGMRKIIAALQVSLDGFIEGPNGEMDWAMADDPDAWADLFEMLEHVDAFILGRVMYPAYEKYWMERLENPAAGTENEVAYARLADRTPHLVLSKTLESVRWKTSRIVRDAEEIRALKQQPGKDMQVVGGAATVSSLLNLGLVDELKLTVCPL